MVPSKNDCLVHVFMSSNVLNGFFLANEGLYAMRTLEMVALEKKHDICERSNYNLPVQVLRRFTRAKWHSKLHMALVHPDKEGGHTDTKKSDGTYHSTCN